MKNIIRDWKNAFPGTKSVLLLLAGFMAIFSSFYLNNRMSAYADSVCGASVHDLFLDAIPERNVDYIFFWGALFWCLALFLYHLIRPRQLSFLIWAYALFVTLRALFITLTHLGPPPNAAIVPSSLSFYAFRADLFFSGHVGGPLFFALLTSSKLMRIVALCYTAFMTVIVFLGHMHYSIDIFASMFIAHSLAVMVKPAEKKFFLNNRAGAGHT